MKTRTHRLPVALRGYDRGQVDDLLGRIRSTLGATSKPTGPAIRRLLAAGGGTAPGGDTAAEGGTAVERITADDVRAARFDIVLRGYEPRAVDELLQECIRELQAAAPIGLRPGRGRVHPGWLIGWIQNARFTGARMRTGYDVRDVDAFLERVITGLRGTAPPVTARDVREIVFRTVRFGPGYDEAEVDAFLVQLAGALERR
ncbi:DivIVA domain-containing protein [Actinomadura rudentiformis]|uniref:DivIVA domain-containing protein n=1 Tax=Actinomadura rudentiformis TaxID=359158 RepID=UPI00178C66A5|nr:DivIVA domain-containing protein [Actinomadura rudentiformis]